MKIFENGKRRFKPYVEFFLIELKTNCKNFDHSTTLTPFFCKHTRVIGENNKVLLKRVIRKTMICEKWLVKWRIS